jgi:hypothetical protein
MEVIHYAYPVVAKYYLQKRGINISTFSRTNTEAFTPEVKEKVIVFMMSIMFLIKRLAATLVNEPVR